MVLRETGQLALAGVFPGLVAAAVTCVWFSPCPTAPSQQGRIPPGSGPTDKATDEGWVEVRVVGTASDRKLMAVALRGQGDAGNRITRCG